MPMHAASTLPDQPWTAIADPQTCVIVEERALGALAADAAALAASGMVHRAQGSPAEIALQLAALPRGMRDDIAALSSRYCALLAIAACRVRLEVLDRQPCWKWHADYVRVRLLTTYTGAGTEYLPSPDANEAMAQQLPLAAIGLFKGHRFANDHAPCIHRSPPFGAGDPVRLLLVIDEVPADDA